MVEVEFCLKCIKFLIQCEHFHISIFISLRSQHPLPPCISFEPYEQLKPLIHRHAETHTLVTAGRNKEDNLRTRPALKDTCIPRQIGLSMNQSVSAAVGKLTVGSRKQMRGKLSRLGDTMQDSYSPPPLYNELVYLLRAICSSKMALQSLRLLPSVVTLPLPCCLPPNVIALT